MKQPTKTLKELNELIAFFNEAKLPKTAQISQAETVTNVARFIESHIEVIKSTSNPEPYLNRLRQLKKAVSS